MAPKQHTKPTNEVAVQKSNLPVNELDYSAYEGQGFETHTKEDYAVPFLGVVQSNSPLVDTNPSAKAGMLINTVTQDLFDGKKGITFIPSYTENLIVEWKPREQGGGFVAMHSPSSEMIKKAKTDQEWGRWKVQKGNPQSNDLIDTRYIYGIFINDEGAMQQMIIACTSTKIKVYKRWMTKARSVQIPKPTGGMQTLPLFAHKYRITTFQEKNAKGSFYNFHVDFDGGTAEKARMGVNDPYFLAAVGFANLIKEGSLKAAYETQQEVGEEPEEEEIPFK